ncbi:hypothetical protein BLOT_003013 [Blomia tropicalis]|nr:hypothetical protein BLOT_003013 [Blomia tropicalis]
MPDDIENEYKLRCAREWNDEPMSLLEMVFIAAARKKNREMRLDQHREKATNLAATTTSKHLYNLIRRVTLKRVVNLGSVIGFVSY